MSEGAAEGMNGNAAENVAEAPASAAPAPAEATTKTGGGAPARNLRRSVVGVVTSDKMDKTIKVIVHRLTKHPVYEKQIRRKTVFTAHDETNEARVGDTVRIMETRRLAKTKTWRLEKILKRAE